MSDMDRSQIDRYKKQVSQRMRYRDAGKRLKLGLYQAMRATQYFILFLALVNIVVQGTSLLTIILGAIAMLISALRYAGQCLIRPWIWGSAFIMGGLPFAVGYLLIPSGNLQFHLLGLCCFIVAFYFSWRAESFVTLDGFCTRRDRVLGSSEPYGDVSEQTQRISGQDISQDKALVKEMLEKAPENFSEQDAQTLEELERLIVGQVIEPFGGEKPRFVMKPGFEKEGVEMADKMFFENIAMRQSRVSATLSLRAAIPMIRRIRQRESERGDDINSDDERNDGV